MTKHKIISGTEEDPIIFGLKTKFFYLFFSIAIGGTFIFSFLFLFIGIKNLIFMFFFFILMILFYRNLAGKSKLDKYTKSTKTILISNKNVNDITE